MKGKLQEDIVKAVKKATGLDIKLEDVLLEYPENEKFGDLSTNIALVLGKKAGKKPLDLAKKICQYLDSCTVAGPGFINFTFDNDFFIKELGEIIKGGDGYGSLDTLKGKTIMVEYAHPNTHKAFHIGHLRNITNGEALVRLLEALGAKVIRANYQGDVGLHIAKCLWYLIKEAVDLGKYKDLDERIKLLADAYVVGNKAYEEDKQVKKEILEINKKIYSKEDKVVNKLWKETRQWSLDYFARIYKRVYSQFDRYYFEEEVALPGKEIVLKAMKKGIFERSKGAVIFLGSKHGLHDRVFVTAEGNPTYEGKDMELGRLQFAEYSPDLIIHNVGPEQAAYFKVVFKALSEIFPYTKGKKYHHISGWVRLKKGKMASRLGNVVLGEWLLDEVKGLIKKTFKEVDDKTTEMIAVGACKYSFLKVSPSKDVAFDFKESVSLSGNSGPYLQYTYARCQSVLKKAKTKGGGGVGGFKVEVGDLNKEELSVLKHLYKFPDVIELAGQEYAPNLICNFLYQLCQKYNGFYNKHKIVGNQFRLGLTLGVATVLKNGLDLLGIRAPEKM